MVKHVDTLGLLFVVWGVLQMAIGVALALIYVLAGGAMGAMGSSTGDDEMAIMGVFMGGIGLFAACTVLVFSVPNLLVGAGLRRRAPWARIGGLVLGALALPSVPFGTALGIYALMVLVDHEVGAEFEKAAASA